MKKILLAGVAVVLLAAGCGSKSAQQTKPDSAMQQTQNEIKSSENQQAEVSVNSADDAVNILEQDAAFEQAALQAGDESDLTASDLSELNSFTEVPDGN